MSVFKQLAGETMYYGISSILGRILHFIVLTPFYTDIFSKTEYGLVTELFTYSAILMVLFTFRMETTFFRFGSDPGKFERSFSTSALFLLFSTLAFVIPLWIFSDQISASFSLEGQSYYIKLILLIIGFDTLAAIPFAKLRLEQKPRKFAFLKVLNVLINLFFVLFFLWFVPNFGAESSWGVIKSMNLDGTGVVYVFWSGLIASTLIFLLLLGTFKGIKLQFDFSLWKKMLGYTLPLVLVGFCAVFNKEAGYLFLKYLLGDSVEEARGVIGIFSANVKLAVIMSLFTQAYNYAIEPFFFNNKHREDNRQLYADSTMLYTMVTSIAFVAILGFLPVLKFIIRNEEMYEGLGVVPLLLFAYILLGIYYNLSVWFKLTDRTIYASIIAISGSIVTALVAIWTIPTWSYYGVAMAALACYLVMVSLSYYWGQKYYKIPYRVGRMGLYLLLAAVVNGLRKMIVDMTQPSFTIELLYGLITVVLFMLIIWQLDRRFLTGLLSRK